MLQSCNTLSSFVHIAEAVKPRCFFASTFITISSHVSGHWSNDQNHRSWPCLPFPRAETRASLASILRAPVIQIVHQGWAARNGCSATKLLQIPAALPGATTKVHDPWLLSLSVPFTSPNQPIQERPGANSNRAVLHHKRRISKQPMQPQDRAC